MEKVLIAGGTGLVGKRLSELLKKEGYDVAWLSRKKNPNSLFPTFAWNPTKGEMEEDALAHADYVINLAGAGVVDKRWTPTRKQLIIDSRTNGNLLFEKLIQDGKLKPKAYLSAAAIGFYGHRGEEILHEESTAGTGFLSESCIAWENAIKKVAATSVRTIAYRIGIVLSTKGGALPQIMDSYKFGVAPILGSGQQWYSWIHIDDLCQLFIYAIKNDKLQGTFNAVAPNPVRFKTLAKAIGKVRGGMYISPPVPKFMLNIIMGEMKAAVIDSVKASSNKVEESGFQFKYEKIEQALKALI